MDKATIFYMQALEAEACGQILTPLLVSCVTMSRLPKLSEPQFPYLENEGNNSASIVWADLRLNKLINGKHWEEPLAYKGPAGEQGQVTTTMNLGFFPQLRCGQHEASLAGVLADRCSATSNEHARVGPSAAWLGVCHGADSVVEKHLSDGAKCHE